VIYRDPAIRALPPMQVIVADYAAHSITLHDEPRAAKRQLWQLAPRNRAIDPDDPREPWSPNYGSVPPTRATAVVKPAAAVMIVPRPAPIIKSAPIDAEDVIRRAVAAHEMRQGD
jgi:hypothetical protein